MSSVELLGLSLLVSVGVAGLAWLIASALEGVSGDARLRDRVWGAALFLPILPPVAMALFLLTPAPVRSDLAIVAPTVEVAQASIDIAAVAPAAEAFRVDGDQAALVLLTSALLLALLRLAVLGGRGRRLGRLLAGAAPASSPMLQSVAAVAGGLGLAAPEVRVSTTGS